MSAGPRVYFICVGNAGRSQMAEAFARSMGLEARSAGSRPASAVDPNAVEAMKEKGIDIAAAKPKVIDRDTAVAADLVVTMGCGDVCPYVPNERVVDWALPDPKGQDLDTVRAIRDDIEDRVRELAANRSLKR